MEVNLSVCKTIAIQHGLPLQFVIKEFHVFNALGQITANTWDTKSLVFKGGTALNKVYFGKAQRFSEDLDFDLDAGNMKNLLGECKQIAEGLPEYEVKEFRRVKDTIQFYCAYENQLEHKDHVRVDVALKKIVSEKPPSVKTAVSEYTQKTVTGFKAYELEDLTARKLHALCTRTEGKDVFDAHHALPLCSKMQGAIKKMLESEEKSLTPREFIEKTVKAVEKTDAKKLRNLTNPFIPLASRPRDWTELKNDLIIKLEKLG